ncbi:S8 family peptidase [Planomicrobium sp. CPCC 101110]|uniref:S8 family peptidase n=1 Tax=Planomicrobium sp. CPCC 101110 TaxID=2599619 RepID=UPI0011B607BB|nr:S8 family peptidase [Planomicrobium sp. CPCC 101110]TWT24849.1 S8 family peptidase [Planomicrobium sp. CPCC 101110]
MNRIHLIPYRIEEITAVAPQIPEGVRMIKAPEVWEKADNGKGNVIAILDTGCQSNHPDLEARIVAGRNFTPDYNDDEANFEDNNGHGTHVAGTAAASLREGGIAGVAPEAQLLILKVLDAQGSGDYAGIIEGIHYAIDWTGPNGEKTTVISMSLGGPDDVPELHEAIKRAVAAGIPVVCAAGNEGDDSPDTDELAYPGAYREVIQVGAIDFNRKIASFSNTNDEIDLVAPGVNIQSAYLNGQYASLSGTSMATPHISGALALIKTIAEKEYVRKLTEAELYAQLVRRTVPLGYPKTAEGNGLLELDALEKVEQFFGHGNRGGV